MEHFALYSMVGFVCGFVYKHAIQELYYELARKEQEADRVLDDMIMEVEHLKPCEDCKTKTDDMEMYKKQFEDRCNELKEELAVLEDENEKLLSNGESWFGVISGK